MPHPGTQRADFNGATPITLSPLKKAHAGQGHQAGPIYLSRDIRWLGFEELTWTVRVSVVQFTSSVSAFGRGLPGCPVTRISAQC
jgi:hypothetical protein